MERNLGIRRVVVTGANGFIGRHVALACAKRGFDVVGIGHGTWKPEDWQQWGLRGWIEANVDLLSMETVGKGADLIFHCAGGASVGASLADPLEDFRRIVLATAEVLEFVRRFAPDCRVVYPSSASVYGAAAVVPTPESAALSPVSPYGTHKLIAERLVFSHAEQFGTRAAIVRLFSVYGSGLRKQLLWDACRKLCAGDGTFMGTGEEVRDWLHVEDAAELLVTASESCVDSCAVMNGGSGQGVTVRQVLQHLSDSLAYGTKVRFSGTQRAGDPDRYVADIQVASALGWQPRMPWARGVEAYAEWWKEQAQ